MTPETLEALAERVAREPVLWVRAAACRQRGESLQLRLLEVTGGEPPDEWETHRWTYPDASFLSLVVPGDAVGGWLRDRRVSIDGKEMIHEAFVEPLHWQRRESCVHGQYQTLPWPHYETTLINLSNIEPAGPLVSDEDAPSFAGFHNAAASFFGLATHAIGRSLPTAAIFRWHDTTARITRVRIRADEVTVDVEGDGLDRLTVELAGDEPGPQQQTWTRPGSRGRDDVTFPLSEGLPSGAWLLVRRGSEWLDRRFLTQPWARGQEQGVEIEWPAQTQIEAFIANRENQNAEFKRQVPVDEDSKARVMKTVCAFANGDGGSLLFGIDDDYQVVGVPAAKASQLVDQITQLIDSWVEPAPPYTFELLTHENSDRVVIELIVSAGTRIYGSSKPNEPRRIYVRHHARSVPARVAEIEGIVRARNNTGFPWVRR